MSANGLGAIAIEKDVVFGRGGDQDLRCDIYRPAGVTEKRTALIQLHGGAFRVGSKDRIEHKAMYYASRGYLCVAAQYRLSHEARWPGPLEDLKACIRWIRANAGDLGIDPARIGAAGYSAGAHLALTLAGTQNRPELEGEGGNPGVGTELAVCLAYYAPSEITRRPDGSEHPLMPEGSEPNEYRRASAISFVSPASPPTMLFHGTADTTIHMESSERMFHALRGANVPVELHILDGVPHEFDRHPELGEVCASLSDLFMDRHIINPRVYPPFQPGPVASAQTS